MRKSQVFAVFVMVFAFFLFAYMIYETWREEITLETQFVPTAVNGLATSTALVVAFGLASLTLGFSNRFFSGEWGMFWVFMLLTLAFFSVGSLYHSYHHLGLGEFQASFR